MAPRGAPQDIHLCCCNKDTRPELTSRVGHSVILPRLAASFSVPRYRCFGHKSNASS